MLVSCQIRIITHSVDIVDDFKMPHFASTEWQGTVANVIGPLILKIDGSMKGVLESPAFTIS